MFEVKVNEQSAGKKDKGEMVQVQMSEDIYLIQKADRDKLQSDIEHLRASIDQLKINNDIKVEHETNKRKQRIEQLKKEMEHKEIENRTRYEALFESKKEMERMNEEKIS
mmetsp:Transcript_34020/g.25112  ORF Transcript_34020/g.25112 Transcript_34020/m.25112 type:complete len:110 (+) Transcript_34020:415-744(+)